MEQPQKDTATINLNIYNELRDFKINMEANNTYRLLHSFYDGDNITYITKDQTIKEMNVKMKRLEGKLSKYRDENYNLRNKRDANYIHRIDLKEWSIWDFIKFKKKK